MGVSLETGSQSSRDRISITPDAVVEAARVSALEHGAGLVAWYTVWDETSCPRLGLIAGAAAIESASICGSCRGSNPRAAEGLYRCAFCPSNADIFGGFAGGDLACVLG